jgi:formate-dependent nitrite reductase membrane component NrfD
MFLFFLIASPLAINGAFSRFRTGPGSKTWERGFIGAWLWVGQIGGVGLGLYIPWVFRKWDDIRKEKLQLVLLVCITVLIGSPAVGGYFAVWQMLKNYGNCTGLF